MNKIIEKKPSVAGCGYWGKNLVRDFHGLGALAAVSDTNADTAKAIASQYDIPARDVEEILADENIDGAVIAAPAEYHATLALKSFAAGKHVYVEKPSSLNIEDAKQMIKAAEDADRILMVGHLLQYHPVFLKLKEMVSAGEVGTLRYIYSRRLSLGKLRTAENVIWSFAPHDISMILTLAGQEPQEVHGRLKPQSAAISKVHLSPHVGRESPPLFDSPTHHPGAVICPACCLGAEAGAIGICNHRAGPQN